MLMPLVIMLGCSGDDDTGKEETDSATQTSTETATETSTETETTTSTDTETETETTTDTSTETTDTSTETEADADFILQISDAEGLKAGLAQVYLSTEGEGPPPLGEGIAVSGELTAGSQSIGVSIGVPDSSTMEDIEDGISGSMFAPFLFADSNNNDIYDDGESITGFGRMWVGYVTDDLPDQGFSAGWNAVEMSFGNEEPVFGDTSNVPLTQNIPYKETFTLGGSFDTTMGERRMAVVSSVGMENEDYTALIDQNISHPWSLTLDTPPPESHFVIEEDFTFAMETIIVYKDDNASGALEVNDLIWGVHSVCSNGRPLSIMYIPPADSLSHAMIHSMNESFSTGWNVFVAAGMGGMDMFSEADAQQLDITSSCTLGG